MKEICDDLLPDQSDILSLLQEDVEPDIGLPHFCFLSVSSLPEGNIQSASRPWNLQRLDRLERCFDSALTVPQP
jgi:hypothetical protein